MKRLLLIALVAACGGTDSDAEKPDAGMRGRPDAAETPPDASVEVDAFVTPPCTAMNDTCTGETVCIAGTCEAAFGRLYDVRAISVTVPSLDPDGYYWDFGGGAPDLFVTISINGVVRAATTSVADQFSATFAGPYAVQPVGGGSIQFVAYDEDINVNDLAYACGADPLTAAQLRSRQLSCTTGGNTLSFTIEPR